MNIGSGDAKREIKYSDQWNRENFIQHDFYTPDINDEPKDQGVSLELLRAKLEELMNEEAQDYNEGDGRSTILSSIRGRPIILGLGDKTKAERQGLLQLIWEFLFGFGTTTTAGPSDNTVTTTANPGGGGSDGSGSGSGSSATTAPPNRTRRPTKYKNRGYCKNPPKTHLPENNHKDDER